MKMDGRDSAECQNWERMDIMVILEFDLNDNKTKHSIVLSPTYAKRTKNGKKRIKRSKSFDF